MGLLSVDDLTVRLDGHTILSDVGFDLSAGTWVGLLGPNGSGKTTLLRALGGHLPFQGTIMLDGRPVEQWTATDRARRLAYVQQAPSLTFDFTVEDLVLLGRTPHRGWMQRYQSNDRERARDALRRVDLEGFADRSVLSLSGGERQRVFLAQALVQDADLLLLDEPTSHLDVQYQFSVLEEVQALVAAGRTVITVFHDLERASRYAERLLILNDGRLVADGPSVGVLTPECIAEVFGMEARVESRSEGGVHIDYVGPVSASEDGSARQPAVSVTNS